MQVIAAGYFIIDGFEDVLGQLSKGVTADLVMECVVAFALLLAVVVGALELRRALASARETEKALLAARGAMADLVALKFAEWKLSASEADVARFAMKGCTIGEIARMRNSAEGTVRSQLSNVYAKAGVASQSMLVAQFIDELL
ncbi:MAG: hypothetical protein KDE55_14960 [Novosphingobium sp.]|nr:hypothetical protein [Novosphingobium sp.]